MVRSVVIVCDGAGLTGGTERVAIANAVGLAYRGVRVGFFGGEGELAPELEAHSGIQAVTLGLADAYHAASKAELLKRFFYNREAGHRFGEYLKGFDPAETVVHIHAFRRVLSASVVRVAKKMGFRLVVTLHDFGIADPNTNWFDYPEGHVCPLKPMSLACWRHQCTHTGWKGKAMQMARATVNGPMLRVWGEFDHFVHVSPFSRSILESYVPEGKPQTTIDNPVAVEQGPRAEAEGSRDFVFVGRVVQEKGAVLFARAAKKARVSALFLGDGLELAKVKMANYDADTLGWSSAEDVQRAIGRARAVVFPSLWLETAGLGALEALARGVPVIVSDRCAAAEYVQDGVTGRVFPMGDEAALVAALRAHADEDIEAMSRAAYDRYWSDPFTRDRYLDRIQAVYGSLFKSAVG